MNYVSFHSLTSHEYLDKQPTPEDYYIFFFIADYEHCSVIGQYQDNSLSCRPWSNEDVNFQNPIGWLTFVTHRQGPVSRPFEMVVDSD